jgi:hypothetical protein
MAYFSPGNCLTYLKDDELAVYLCNPSDRYLPFIFATLESACPFLGDPLSRILPAIDTMENMDRSRREDAEPFLKTEDIRFMNARNVEIHFLQFFNKYSRWRLSEVNYVRTTNAAQCQPKIQMK